MKLYLYGHDYKYAAEQMLLTLPRPMARSRAGFTSARRYIKIRRGPRRSTAPVGNQQHLLGGVFVVVSV